MRRDTFGRAWKMYMAAAMGAAMSGVAPGAARIEALAPFVGGAWVIEDAAWSFGMVSDVRETYRWALDGAAVVSDTFVSDDGGPEYHRYRTVYICPPDAEHMKAYSFAYDGTVTISDVAVDGRELRFIDGSEIDQRSVLSVDGGSFEWSVARVVEGGEPEQLVRATARRVSRDRTASRAWAATPAAIAAAPGDVSGRAIRKEVVVRAPVADVWRWWTTERGLAEWLVGFDAAGEPNCDLELRIGGPFEWYFSGLDVTPEGKRGSEGCVVLAYEPRKMLSYTWNAPPKFAAEREMRTWVVLGFEATGERETTVSIAHLGWPESGWSDGSNWPDVFAYFDSAWAYVAAKLQEHAASIADDPTKVLVGRLAPLSPRMDALRPMLGSWECTTKWEGRDEPFWARMECSPMLNGKFVQTRSYTKDAERGVFERYLTITAAPGEAGGAFTDYDFAFDGTVSAGTTSVLEEAGATVFRTEWPMGARSPEGEVRSEVRFAEGAAPFWVGFAKVRGGGEWEKVMEGEWVAAE